MCTRELVLGVAVLALSLSAARAETDHAKLVVQVRSEVPDKWHVMYDEKQTAYVATSPIYALEYKEGCVMYRQAFPVINGNVSFARMDFYKLYFAGAAGDECFGISQSRFFAMEEGAEPYSTLDFIRHVYNGPESSRDRVKPVELPRLEACFASQARRGATSPMRPLSPRRTLLLSPMR
jgi:hypothetical protein